MSLCEVVFNKLWTLMKHLRRSIPNRILGVGRFLRFFRSWFNTLETLQNKIVERLATIILKNEIDLCYASICLLHLSSCMNILYLANVEIVKTKCLKKSSIPYLMAADHGAVEAFGEHVEVGLHGVGGIT